MIKTNIMNNKVKKVIIRVLLGLISFILLLVITGFLIVYFNQDKIKRIFVTELNKSLRSEISVKDIDFSVFAKFPNASLRFKDVLAKDAITSLHKDTLLAAKSIYLEFNLWDIYYKDYKIKKIEINNYCWPNFLSDIVGKSKRHNSDSLQPKNVINIPTYFSSNDKNIDLIINKINDL